MIEPLLSSGLITRRLTQNNPSDVTRYYEANRSYATDVNTFEFQGCKATVLLKDNEGHFLNATSVRSLTRNVLIQQSGQLVDVTGVIKAGLIKCAAFVGGKWVYFDLRFV